MVNGNFVCDVCNKSFYKTADGKCIAVPKKIDFCLYYSSADLCSICLRGYVLTKDKKACSNDIQFKKFSDPFCEQPFESPTPVCNVCQASYNFESETSLNCVKCSETISQGCLVCDMNDRTKCLLCNPGYYMNKNTECIIQVDQKQEVTLQFERVAKFSIFFLLILLIK